jgi:hypothetical protein
MDEFIQRWADIRRQAREARRQLHWAERKLRRRETIMFETYRNDGHPVELAKGKSKTCSETDEDYRAWLTCLMAKEEAEDLASAMEVEFKMQQEKHWDTRQERRMQGQI